MYLETAFGETIAANATGFIVNRDGVSQLVTNFHVVNGHHPKTLASLDRTAVWPDTIRILHVASGAIGRRIPKAEPLHDSEASPLWLEHARYGSRVDVVALPLTDLDGVAVYDYDPCQPGRAATQMAGRLRVVGFPFSNRDAGSMDTWVQGFIATETEFDADGLPQFLIHHYTGKGWVTRDPLRPNRQVHGPSGRPLPPAHSQRSGRAVRRGVLGANQRRVRPRLRLESLHPREILENGVKRNGSFALAVIFHESPWADRGVSAEGQVVGRIDLSEGNRGGTSIDRSASG